MVVLGKIAKPITLTEGVLERERKRIGKLTSLFAKKKAQLVIDKERIISD